jgi:hypothetical protein
MTFPDVRTALLFLVVVATGTGFVVAANRLLFSYALLPDRIRVFLLNWIPVLDVSFEDIVSIDDVSWFERRWRMLRLGNRMFARRAVMIERADGVMYRFIRITPELPEEFVANVRAEMVRLRLADRGSSQ